MPDPGTDIGGSMPYSNILCHQTTSKNLNPYFVHLLPSYIRLSRNVIRCLLPIAFAFYFAPVKDKNVQASTSTQHVLRKFHLPLSNAMFSTVISLEHSPLSIHLSIGLIFSVHGKIKSLHKFESKVSWLFYHTITFHGYIQVIQ